MPIKKIKERWQRSLHQLPWFLKHADWALLFDNSDQLRIIGRKEGGTVVLDPTAPPEIQKAIEKIRTAKR